MILLYLRDLCFLYVKIFLFICLTGSLCWAMESGNNPVNKLLADAISEKNNFFTKNKVYQEIISECKLAVLGDDEQEDAQDNRKTQQNSDVELKDLKNISDRIQEDNVSVLKIFHSKYNKANHVTSFVDFVSKFFTSGYDKCLIIEYIRMYQKGTIKGETLPKTVVELSECTGFKCYKDDYLNKEIDRFLPNTSIYGWLLSNGYQFEDTNEGSQFEDTNKLTEGVSTLICIFRQYFSQTNDKAESWNDKITIENITWSQIDDMIDVVRGDINCVLTTINSDNIKTLLQASNVSIENMTIIKAFLCKEITYLISQKVNKDRLNINGVKQLIILYKLYPEIENQRSDLQNTLIEKQQKIQALEDVINRSAKQTINREGQPKKEPNKGSIINQSKQNSNRLLLFCLFCSLACNAWFLYAK